MEKAIYSVTPKTFTQNTDGFKTVNMFHSELEIEPFLVFTEFHMNKPIFGPHPHAGVSVMTYIMPDSENSFTNRDSNGDTSIIEPGGIHVTQAGSGVHHDEVPTLNGIDAHGFQIWINHSDKNRLVAPKAFHAKSSEIPVIQDENKEVRVLQGEFQNLKSTIDLVTKTTLLDITLQPNVPIELDASEMAFIYLMEGEIISNSQVIEGRNLVKFNKDGNKVVVKTNNEKAHFLFASGTPHNEPIVYGGPFVMTTNEQMLATQKRARNGEMGVLD
jgi:quercetin 2,3-dioxygenase